MNPDVFITLALPLLVFAALTGLLMLRTHPVRSGPGEATGAILLTFRAMRIWRAACSLAILGVGIGLLATDAVQGPLSIAVLLLGVFAFGHLLVDDFWHNSPSGAEAEEKDTNGAGDFASAFRDTAAIYISTPGVVLGLLAVFGEHLHRETIRVASIALAVTLLLGVVVQGLLVGGVPSDEARLAFLGYFLNVLLWALALGTLCVALTIVYS